MRFTSTQVIVSIDGTDRITATDSSITPTRMGIYGDRANITATSTGFHLSDISFVGRAILNPARETDAAQALTFVPVGSITCNEYGEARISVGRLSGSPTLERGPDGSTWTDVTSEAFVDMDSGSSRTIVDHRPQYGAGSVDWGDTIHYRLTDGANVLTFSVTADVDKQQVRRNSWAVMSAYMATQTNGCVASQAGSYYPGEWLVSMALGYLETATAQYLTDAQNQYTYAILPLIDANDVLHFPAFSSTDRDYHCRTALHLSIASILMRYANQQTFSDQLAATADLMGKAFFDEFNGGSPTTSHTRASYYPSDQAAWPANTTVTAGDIFRATTNNGHTYRVQGTVGQTFNTGSTEPTWPTTQGATVTVNGVTYKETGATAPCTAVGYNPTAPYATAAEVTVDPNKNASEALMLAFLLADTRSSFYSAGTYRTKGLDHVEDVCQLVAACQGSGGRMSLGDAWTPGEDAYDTLYAGYTLQQLAGIYVLLGAVTSDLPLVIDRTLNWLETRAGGASEPYTRIKYGGSSPWGSANVGIGDLLWRSVGARLFKRTSVSHKVPYSGAFWDAATARYTPYTPDGGGTPYSALYQAVWEADAVIEAIIARIDLTPATETDTAVALSYGRAFSIIPATETDAAVAITVTQPHAYTVTPATETDAAVGITFQSGSHYVTLTSAVEVDTAVAITSTSGVHHVTLTPATEVDQAVALSVGATLTGPKIPLPATADFVSARSQTANFVSATGHTAGFTTPGGQTADFIPGPT